MKNLSILFILLIFYASSLAQNTFSKGFSYGNFSNAFENSRDTGFIVSFTNKFFKVDRSGNWVWGKSLQLDNTLMCKSYDSCYFLAGINSLTDKIICLKFTEQGDTLWTCQIDIPSSTTYPDWLTLSKVIQASDSSFILIGSQAISNSYYSEMFVLKISGTGNFVWKKTYTLGNMENTLTDICESPDHNFFICGGYEQHDTSFSYSGALLKISSSGDVLWNRAFIDTSAALTIKNIGLLSSGLLMAIAKNRSLIFAKTDWNGNVLWAKTSSVSTTGSSSFYGGFRIKDSNDIFYSGRDSIIHEIDSSGNFLHDYISLEGHEIDTYILTPEHGLAYTAQGYTGPFIVSDDSIFSSICLIPSSPIGTIPTSLMTDSLIVLTDSGGVETNGPVPNSSIILYMVDKCPDIQFTPQYQHNDYLDVYPNPTKGELNFNFSDHIMPESIQLINLTGQVIMEIKPASSIEKVMINHVIPSGIYACRFNYSDGEVTRMIVVE